MKLGRSILGSAAGRVLAARLAAWYVTLLHATMRWTMGDDSVPARYWERGDAFIVCFWHGRMLLVNRGWRRGVPLKALISLHRDGELIARVMDNLGIDTVRGSSGRGGSEALRDMVQSLEAGTSIALTPDGPRGPRMRASEGVVMAARLSGRPIVPCAYSAAPAKVMASWDRFLVPLPFARGVFLWGTPIFLPRDADGSAIEETRQAVESQLNTLTARADALVGRAPVAPAAPGGARGERPDLPRAAAG